MPSAFRPNRRLFRLQHWDVIRKELLPLPCAHVVFTAPHFLAQLALQNRKFIYTLLLRLSAEMLIQVARNSKRLWAELSFFRVLQTWTQKMEHHLRVHCLVRAGGLPFDPRHWI